MSADQVQIEPPRQLLQPLVYRAADLEHFADDSQLILIKLQHIGDRQRLLDYGPIEEILAQVDIQHAQCVGARRGSQHLAGLPRLRTTLPERPEANRVGGFRGRQTVFVDPQAVPGCVAVDRESMAAVAVELDRCAPRRGRRVALDRLNRQSTFGEIPQDFAARIVVADA